MKKLIFTIVLASIFSTTAFAQISAYGIKGGLNLSKLKTKFDGDTETSDNRLSFHAGGFLVLDLAEKIALQPELVLSFEGGKEEILNEDFVYNFVQINIPVLLRYSVTEEFNLYAGPQIAINAAAKGKYDGDSDDLEDVSTLGFGLGLGLGYYVTEQIEIGLRYNAGLSNWNNGDNSDDEKAKLNTLQIGVSYRLK